MLREYSNSIGDAEKASSDLADRRARRARFGKGAGNSGKLDNMLKEAASYVPEPVENFDTDPLAFICLSGTLRLIPRQDKNGDYYELEEFPHEMGDLICRILDDYAATVPFETLAGDDRRKGSEATPELARLFGKRLVRSSEPEQKMVFRESLVKSLTSGEEILVRRLHHEFVPLRPEFKLVVSGNHKPRIEGAGDGIWRRVTLVSWPVQIAKDRVDKMLPDKLWRSISYRPHHPQTGVLAARTGSEDGIGSWQAEIGNMAYQSIYDAGMKAKARRVRAENNGTPVPVRTRKDRVRAALAEYGAIAEGHALGQFFKEWIESGTEPEERRARSATASDFFDRNPNALHAVEAADRVVRAAVWEE